MVVIVYLFNLYNLPNELKKAVIYYFGIIHSNIFITEQTQVEIIYKVF